MRDRLSNRRSAGYTVTELLIVLVMIGLMSAVTIPYFLRVTPGEEVAAAADNLANAMRLTRYRAIALNREVYLHLEPQANGDFYTAYVNLGDPGDVPTGTSAEVDAVRIAAFKDAAGAMRGRSFPESVSFGTGTVSSGPGGSSASQSYELPANPLMFHPRGTVDWPDDNLARGTIFITHDEAQDEVRAVTIGRTGIVKVWSLIEGNWK